MPDEPGSASPRSILFVCTGNVHRSPYAEFRARQLFGDTGLTFASAGVPGTTGVPMHPRMVRELVKRGAPAPRRASRTLDATLLESHDLVICATTGHRQLISASWPHAAPKTFTFGQLSAFFKREPDAGHTWPDLLLRIPPPRRLDDVRDPLHIGPWSPRAVAVVLDQHLRVIIPALARQSQQASAD